MTGAASTRALVMLGVLSAGCAPARSPRSAPPDSAVPLSVAPMPPAPAPVEDATPKEIVVLDSGSREDDPRVTTLVGAQRLAPEERQRILDRVFGANGYLRDHTHCGAVLAGSDFAPTPWQMTTGAFTAAHVEQSLWVFTTGECGASHANNWGTITLVVLEGDAIVARAQIAGGATLARLVDIDGGGRDEVVITSGFTNQGHTTTSAALFRFETSGLVEVESFGEVFASDCGAYETPQDENVTIIRAVVRRQTAPEFKREKTTRPCRP